MSSVGHLTRTATDFHFLDLQGHVWSSDTTTLYYIGNEGLYGCIYLLPGKPWPLFWFLPPFSGEFPLQLQFNRYSSAFPPGSGQHFILVILGINSFLAVGAHQYIFFLRVWTLFHLFSFCPNYKFWQVWVCWGMTDWQLIDWMNEWTKENALVIISRSCEEEPENELELVLSPWFPRVT